MEERIEYRTGMNDLEEEILNLMYEKYGEDTVAEMEELINEAIHNILTDEFDK